MKTLFTLLFILFIASGCKKDKDDPVPSCTTWTIQVGLVTINNEQYHATVFKKLDTIEVNKAVTDTNGIRAILAGVNYTYSGAPLIWANHAIGKATFAFKHHTTSNTVEQTINSTCN